MKNERDEPNDADQVDIELTENEMEKAQAIADALEEELDATRERRRPIAERIEKGFDELE